MKIGDRILIKTTVSAHNMRGVIVSSIPGYATRSYVVKIHYGRPLYFVLGESEFSRIPESQDVMILNGSFCTEEGSDGVITQILPGSRYLCEFTGPFCNIELDKEEIAPFDPERKQFALLNKVRLLEDIPEHNLKKGMEGVIILVFFKPNLAYCVEFFLGEGAENEWEDYNLLPDQLELVSEVPY